MSITSVKNDTLGKDSFVNSQKPVPPTISGYTISGVDDTALDPAGGQTILINGTGFQRGATVVVDGTTVSVVSFINSNQLSFTSIAKSAGSYAIYVVNADLGTAIYIPGLIYSTLPTWTTGAGSLGSYYETTTISNTVVAGGDAPLTYALASGTLPSGATLSSGGVITGTSPADTGSTTYSFTVEAIDAQLQSSTRSFSLTINTDVVTWNSPGTNTTVTLDGTAHSSTLNATSAAGYGVAYAADTLPPGLTLTGNTISGTPTTQNTTVSVLTATANTTGRSATNTITWVVSLGDVYFNLTTLLLSGSANTFVSDASTNRFPVTVVGDTRPSNFSPYLTGWSNQFDGTGDFLSFTGSPGTTLTADFTVESWVYLNSASVAQPILCIGDSIANPGILLYFANDSKLSIAYAGARQLTGATSVTANSWNHVAFVRSGSTITAYLNGVSQGTVTNSATFSGTTTVIGREIYNNAVGGQFSGYISNLRIVKGTAVYTTNFTPPTQPLTVIAGTSLLTCADNRFVDDSTNNFAITRNGDVAIRSFSPFAESATTRGSAYFDGTGDYLTVPANTNLALGASDYTVECWVNLQTTQTPQYGIGVIGTYPGSGTGGWSLTLNRSQGGQGIIWILSDTIIVDYTAAYIQPNTWAHIAVCRSGSGTNNTKIFLNGVMVNQVTNNTNDTFSGLTYIGGQGTGQPFTGYISNARVVKGTAIYTANFTPPTQPLTAVANTSLLTLQTNNSHTNNQFVDSSGSNLLVTRSGNATQGTFSPYSPSGWSNYFDGSGDALVATTPNMTGTWTVECWWYPITVTTQQTFISFNNGAGTGINMWCNTSGQMVVDDGTNAQSAFTGATFIANQWNHIAVVRSGTTTKGYINGIQAGSNSFTPATTAAINIGRYSASSPAYFASGYISNVRVVNGTAVYTTNFTPPTQPLTAITGTSLLTCCDNRFIDESPNNSAITRTGDVRVVNFSPFKAVVQTPLSYGTYFDGNSDYISRAWSSQFDLGNTYTIEMWLYSSTATGWKSLFNIEFPLTDYFGGMNIILRGTDNKLAFIMQQATGGGYQSSAVTLADTNTFVQNKWYHVAVSVNSGSGTLYVDGVSKATASIPLFVGNPAGIGIGGHYNGYNLASESWPGIISNFRIVKGTAVYTSNFTPSAVPLTAINNTLLLTCQSPTITDNSVNNFALITNGNTQPTPVNPFGATFSNTNGYTAAEYSGSMYFDGSGDYLDLPNNTIFSQTGAWTLELWVYPTVAQNNYVYSQNTPNFLQINISTAMFVLVDRSGVGTLITSSSTIQLNTWTHLALVSDGTNMRLFINGTQSGSTAGIGTQAASATTTRIGAYQGTGSLGYAGYISDLRLVKGRALYTSNFATPITPLLPVPNTTLLLNGTSAGIVDSTTKNVVETIGDVRVSTAVSKFGGSSMRFDGSGDYLALPASANFTFGTGNFTVEAWVNYVTPTNSGIFQIGSGIFPLTNGVGLGLDSGSRWMLYYANGSAAGTAFGPASNTWYHVAVVRNSGTTKVYLDGVSVMSVTDATNYTGTFLGIGGIYSTSYLMNGYLQDFRITKGSARYTTNFTPPTSALQNK